MRIGITCYPTYGGSGIVATELGLELAQRGHEIHFISYANPIRLDPEAVRACIITKLRSRSTRCSTFRLTAWRSPRGWRRWRRCYDLDLLHVHYAIPHSISALLAQQMLRSETAPAVRNNAARDRYHAGRRGPVVFSDHEVLDRAVERDHHDQRLHGAADARSSSASRIRST